MSKGGTVYNLRFSNFNQILTEKANSPKAALDKVLKDIYPHQEFQIFKRNSANGVPANCILVQVQYKSGLLTKTVYYSLLPM